MSKQCHACGEAWIDKRSPGFRETCIQCGADLYCCKNCRFYDATSYEWCREPQARNDKPRDPAVSNTCDWFVFAESGVREVGQADSAKAGLHALFGEAPPEESAKPADWMQTDPTDKPDLDDLFKA